MAEALCTINRVVLYEICKKTKHIEVVGDSFGLLKGIAYKSLSELEKLVYNSNGENSAKKEAKKLSYEPLKKH